MMLKNLQILFLGFLCAFVMAGCSQFNTAPIENIQTDIVGKYNMRQIQRAILAAGKERDWIMNVEKPGVINATLLARDHKAVVQVVFTIKSYNINYVSSQNLNAQNGQINRNYMRWIHNLDKDIQLQLANQ